jgi:hypothetical protein
MCEVLTHKPRYPFLWDVVPCHCVVGARYFETAWWFYVQESEGILFGHFNAWRCGHHGVSKCRTPITRWRIAVSQKNGDVNLTSAKVWRLAVIWGLPPQSLCHFAWQPSGRVSQTAILPQSHDYSCYVSRPILAPPQLWLQKHTDLRAHDFAQSPDLWHQSRLANLPAP